MDSLFWLESLSAPLQGPRDRFRWLKRLAVVVLVMVVLAVTLAG
jgi:hypothetical protein